jgi:hypothetical protein
MRLKSVLLSAALACLPRAAQTQGVPLGSEFRVNTYTTGYQYLPSATAGPSGDFIVVWNSNGQDGSLSGIFGQRYASSGMPLGTEFRANTFTTSWEFDPSVAADASGRFVVVWESRYQDGSFSGVFGQRFDNGSPLGLEFRVNTHTPGYQRLPAVASDLAGNFVVVWSSMNQDGSDFGVFGQRYANSGIPLGPEFRVNTYTTGSQFYPSVAMDPSGGFIIVWKSDAQDGSSWGVFAQRYAGSGAPLGPEFRVNTYTTGDQLGSSVTADASGNFVVVWHSSGDTSGYGVFGQRFAVSGTPTGPEFRVNTSTMNEQRYPSIGTDSLGNFVVVWQTSGDASGYGVFGQRFASSGTPLGSEFRVNTFTTYNQARPSLAADVSGRFVVVWESRYQDGSVEGVFGQRFDQVVPVDLMRFVVQ